MLHKHGGDIYIYDQIRDFSANINFLGMPQAVRSAALQAIDQSVHYPDPQYRTLRQALAKRETTLCGQAQAAERCGRAQDRRAGEGYESGKERIAPEHIICGNGAAELMFVLAAVRRPKRALLAVPSFFEYEQALSANGCRISRFYMSETHGFCLEDSFLEAVDDSIDMVILGNPNNPTGRLLEGEFLDKLLIRCRSCHALLILDESFFDFLTEKDLKKTYSGVRKIAGKSLSGAELFIIKSFTKMYAIPGLRFGYGISGDEELLRQMRCLMQPWNVSVPAAVAAQAAAGELAFARKTAQITEVNRDLMKTSMEALGYRVFPSCANFLLFEGSPRLKEICLKAGYLIRDCGNFPGLEKTEERAFYRVCVRSQAENTELLKILQQVQ